VGVQQDPDARADRLAHRGDHVDAEILARRRDLPGQVAGMKLERRPAEFRP
jgi:hypothetical protein